MTVEYTRPEVTAKLPSWKLVRDACAGSEAVKAGEYLSEINPHDLSPENRARNAARLAGAVYFNATGRTLGALVGIAFGKWPEIKLPAAIEYVLKDVDGSGVGLVNQAQIVVSDVLQTGRAGLLVDYPSTRQPASRAAADAGEVRASIALYAAESIINWRTVKRGSRNLLGMVVLRETTEEWSNFERTEKVRFRELALGRLSGEDETVPERYVVRVWAEDKANGAYSVVEEYAPLKGDGRPWEVIPFSFVGATNNDAMPDQAPLYDLADLNIAHFRNSADHEESLFFAGQAQVWVTGADQQWLDAMQEAGIYFGSRAIGVAPQGGDVKLVQAQPVSALAEEMKHKVELMAQLGARLVAPGAVKTATEANSDDKTSHSVLSIVCDNVSDAYRTCLRWMAEFMRAAGDTDFTIGTEFSGVQFDAQQMAQALAAVQSGKLPESDFWTYCRSIGLIASDKTDEQIRDEVEAQGSGVDLEDEGAE